MDRKEPCWAPRIVFTLLFAFACVGIAAFAPQNKFSHVSKLPDALLHRIAYAQGPSQKVRLKIMPLGDSITWGTPDLSYGGYRHLLGTLLSNDGYSFEFVGSGQSGLIPSPNNEGHFAWTIPQIKNGIDSKGWLETYQPDIVLLHIGTNDLRPRVGGAASAPDILSTLLDDILARLSQAHVIVAQIIPFGRGPDQVHQSYNAAIPGIVASKGPRVSTVDMQNILSRSDYADGFHPNAGGYDKMARAWEPAIRAVIPGSAQRDETPAPRGASAAAAVPEVNPTQNAPGQISARQPRGIYGVVLAFEHHPYTATIDNPAISGLFLYYRWSALEPKEGQLDFSSVEEAFKIADSKHKTIQITLLPGFWTPQWLLDELPSCDGWLASGGKTGPAPPNCGKATFGYTEGVKLKGELHELPLPWNPVYKRDWHEFLVEFARRFGQREAFVSIAVAGPTSQSEEIIMPHSGPGETEKWARLLQAFYADPSYHRSNKAFVEEWKTEIDDYGRIFSNVTLALTRAGGLPFNPPRKPEASTLEIAAYFASTPLGSNAKATQNNGVGVRHPLTMRPVKAMALDTTLNPRVLAGGEFTTGFARDPARMGCPIDDKSSPACQKNITPEQAFTNVLAVFFAGTPYGHLYGSPDGRAPVQYLQIYQEDIVYANSHPAVQAILLEASKRFLSPY
jgi:lysophospholipase L1-like esterase